MSTRFDNRSYENEWLDESDIPQDLLYRNLQELDVLNRNTGGHVITLDGIKQLVTDRSKAYHIVDLGCGSGDTLRAIADWARVNRFSVRLTGVDMNSNVIGYLGKHCSTYPEIKGVAADYREFLDQETSADIVCCSLFCHHLDDNELLKLLAYFKEKVTTGFVINDLERSRMAYYSAWLFTRVLNGTPLAKNDGPISVLRAFKEAELKHLLEKANIHTYMLQKRRFFRFLIVGRTNGYGTHTT
ncbi:MAG TPA: methyltransferase domain-containing protein [Bacteroidales bacterium]|nr:methyltransferase domain-containing protein [Bacteroidales bacterium]